MTRSHDPRSSEIEANLARASDSLQAAELLMQAGHKDAAASRAYYAAFYAATAALLSQGVEFGKHGQVIGAIQRFFVKEGRLSAKQGKDLVWLFELRMLGDYGETRRVTSEEAARALNSAREFVEAITHFCEE